MGMPFRKESVLELRERLSLSQTGLCGVIQKYAKKNRMPITTGQSKGGISKWENGRTKPSIHNLDILYMIARDNGYHDLKFFIVPTGYKS